MYWRAAICITGANSDTPFSGLDESQYKQRRRTLRKQITENRLESFSYESQRKISLGFRLPSKNIRNLSSVFRRIFWNFQIIFFIFKQEHKGGKCVLPLNPNTFQENSQLISLALRKRGGQSMNPYLCSGISQFGHDRLGSILIQYIKTNSLSV